MSDIPPRQPVDGTGSARVESARGLPPLPPVDPQPDIDATGALISLHQAATQSGPDSFPVLKAFQEYLESERRRARRRVALVTSLFAGLTVVLVAAFLAAGILLFSYMKEREERLWRRIEQQPALATTPVSADPSPAATAATALEQELRTLAETLAALKHDHAELRETLATTPATSSVRTPEAEVEAAAHPAAEPEPRTLPSAGAPAPAETAAAARTPPVPTPPTPSADAGPRPAALEIPDGVKPPAPPAGYAESGIYLRPGGHGAPIPWRVYVPAP